MLRGEYQLPRPIGARNKDFESKRQALLDKLTEHALNSDLRRPSLRQFAIAAGASEPTLRHYFTDRKGLVIAILEEIGRRGTLIWDTISAPAQDQASAIMEYFRISEAGMRHGGFVRAHAFGIIEGVADEEAGRAYLQHVLEPALEAISKKLQATPGAPSDDTVLQAAALATLSPMLVVSLHQDLLGGKSANPIKADEVLLHIQQWLGKSLTN